MRRAQYRDDPEQRAAKQEVSRERARAEAPLPPSRLRNGLLQPGTERELTVPGRARTSTMESYTIPEAAAALGRSMSNFRRWLENDIVPAPILGDASRNVACYSVGELEIIAEVLREHERTFSSLCASHTETILRISQRLHGFRDVEFAATNVRTR